MQNVLADLALESEAAMTLTMRIARAMDNRADEHEDLLVRLVTAVGKYWICKRTPGHAYEAMECIGGSGVMEDSMMPRLFRESPVNAIWEGSGNVQCLDVLRALSKTPAVVDAFFAEVAKASGAHAALDRYVAALATGFQATCSDFEYRARDVVDRMALALQASLLVRHAPAFVSDAFCRSRLEQAGPPQLRHAAARCRCRRHHRARDAQDRTRPEAPCHWNAPRQSRQRIIERSRITSPGGDVPH